MKSIYKITKYFKGGSDVYYIKTEKITEDILENIGEHTTGGHAGGYKIKSCKIHKLPKGEKLLSNTVTYRIY